MKTKQTSASVKTVKSDGMPHIGTVKNKIIIGTGYNRKMEREKLQNSSSNSKGTHRYQHYYAEEDLIRNKYGNVKGIRPGAKPIKTIKHKVKLIKSRFEWWRNAINVIINGDKSRFDKIIEKQKQIKEKFLLLDKQVVKKESYNIAKAEYELINYVASCLKD